MIATGVTTVEASLAVGVSWPDGTRWFLHAGGMPPISLAEPTGRYLSFEEREEIALLRARQVCVREIARGLGRDPGTISRELRRNAATRGGKAGYRALVAQWKAQQAAKRPKTAKLAVDVSTTGCFPVMVATPNRKLDHDRTTKKPRSPGRAAADVGQARAVPEDDWAGLGRGRCGP